MFQAVLYGKRLKNMPEFSDPEQMDETKLREIGSALGAMGKKYIARIPVDALMKSIDVIKEAAMSPSQVRRFFSHRCSVRICS